MLSNSIILQFPGRVNISTTSSSQMPYEERRGPKDWPRYNKKVFPPQEIDEQPRQAVCIIIIYMPNNLRSS